MGNTVSCYFLDPEGNCVEVYALVAERDEARINRKLDLDKNVDEIVAQASGLGGHPPPTEKTSGRPQPRVKKAWSPLWWRDRTALMAGASHNYTLNLNSLAISPAI